MKSERRHDLETNTLATELATWGERVRPYASSIVMAVAVAAGVFPPLSPGKT